MIQTDTPYVLSKQGGSVFRSSDWRLVYVEPIRLDVRGLYEILDIHPDSSDSEIKRFGKARLLETHPDMGGDPDEFIKVRDAYLILSDPVKRSEYDSLQFDVSLTLVRTTSTLNWLSESQTDTEIGFLKSPAAILEESDLIRIRELENLVYSYAFSRHISVKICIGITHIPEDEWKIGNGAVLFPKNSPVSSVFLSFAVLCLSIIHISSGMDK